MDSLLLYWSATHQWLALEWLIWHARQSRGLRLISRFGVSHGSPHENRG